MDLLIEIFDIDFDFIQVNSDYRFIVAIGCACFVCIVGQMFYKLMVRQLHNSYQAWNAEKSLLATLRKKTGYTFANCKKALELSGNDLFKAEAWLKEQAQSLGWAKAVKLQGRQTKQGLVGVLVQDRAAAMVEINCETDFVARNENFIKMVDSAAQACVNFGQTYKNTQSLTKLCFDSEQLADMKSNEGTPLSAQLALMIGTVGENAIIKRATCYVAAPDVHLFAFSHPFVQLTNGTLLGRYAGITALKRTQDLDIDLPDVGKKLCQHIVGMDPKRIGCINNDKQNEFSVEEDCLIYQEYLHDDQLLVKDFLQENGLEVVDFKRFAVGETEIVSEPLENVETCQ